MFALVVGGETLRTEGAHKAEHSLAHGDIGLLQCSCYDIVGDVVFCDIVAHSHAVGSLLKVEYHIEGVGGVGGGVAEDDAIRHIAAEVEVVRLLIGLLGAAAVVLLEDEGAHFGGGEHTYVYSRYKGVVVEDVDALDIARRYGVEAHAAVVVERYFGHEVVGIGVARKRLDGEVGNAILCRCGGGKALDGIELRIARLKLLDALLHSGRWGDGGGVNLLILNGSNGAITHLDIGNGGVAYVLVVLRDIDIVVCLGYGVVAMASRNPDIVDAQRLARKSLCEKPIAFGAHMREEHHEVALRSEGGAGGVGRLYVGAEGVVGVG